MVSSSRYSLSLSKPGRHCNHAVLNLSPLASGINPIPSIFEIDLTCLSLLILSSWMKDHFLSLASYLLSLPVWWIFSRGHSTWALIAINDSLLWSCLTISAFSWLLAFCKNLESLQMLQSKGLLFH